ncbi:MAG: hypothetical protein IJ333_03565 [Clostridia bacterium]|nr:hypothetical protein [Clostridia bacterium]
MNFEYENRPEKGNDPVGCPVVGYQDVDVCVPVTIKPFGEVGNAKTQCLGKPVVYPDCDRYPGKPHEVCKFTISQRLRVEVPVIFGARAEVGDALVDCGCAEEKDDHKDCNHHD